jgi:hypothetical protein
VADLGFSPFLSEAAAEFILVLPRRQARRVMDRLRQLALSPGVEPDYLETDETGRKISQICEVDFELDPLASLEWCATWESNPPLKLGKLTFYR